MDGDFVNFIYDSKSNKISKYHDHTVSKQLTQLYSVISHSD